MELLPRDSGVYAKCDCGSRQYIPVASMRQHPVLFCPCGEVHKIPEHVLDDMTKRRFRHHIRRTLQGEIEKSRALAASGVNRCLCV